MENFRLGNTTITFSDDFEILNEFRQAVKAGTDGISPGTDISKGIKEGRKPNVDRLAHGYTDYLNSIFTEELVPLAVNFLVHYDIYDCSEELFIRKYQEKYFLMDNRPEFKKFLQEYTAISDEYSQKKAYQKVYRANRSKWIGGGFGIKGAIKGSIDATILNTATGLFRGIGDGIDDFYSSVEFKNQKEDLLTENLFDNIDSAFSGFFRFKANTLFAANLLAVQPGGQKALTGALVQIGNFFFGLLKGQLDLLFCQGHQIFVDALQDEVHICPCHGNAAGQGFFVGLGVDVVLFQEHQPDALVVEVFVQSKTFFCISGHPGHRIEHYHISGSQNPVELQPFRAKNGCASIGFLHDMGSRVLGLDVADLTVNALLCRRDTAIAIDVHASPFWLKDNERHF